MKYEYIKKGKLNFRGNQYRKGAIFEFKDIKHLPENWFKKVKILKIKKVKVDEKPEKIVIKSIVKKEEVIDNGNNKYANKDVDR